MTNARSVQAARVLAWVAALGLAFNACGRGASRGEAPASEQHGSHEAEAEHRDEASPVIELSEEAMRRAGIVVEQVRAVPGGQLLLAPAELQPNADRLASVGPRVSGRIQRVMASLGADVRAGQSLATIWSPEAAEARAALESARAAEQVARRSLERERALFERRVAAEREVLEAEAALAKAEGEATAAAARLAAMGFPAASANERRREPVVPVTSPIAGTVIERTASVDAPVGPETVLFTIADLRTLWLTVRVPEASAAGIRKGQTVDVSLAALPDRSVLGRIAYVSPIVSTDTRTVDVRVEVPNRARDLRPGMTATARIDLPERVPGRASDPPLLVPRAAVQELNQASVVFVPAGDRQFKAQPVTVGASYGSDVELLSGVEAGDRIVVRGAFTLKAQALRGAGADHHH